MDQPTPTVSRADVLRVLRRDYPDELFDELLSLLDRYGVEDWQRERDRVQLAVLKLAGGDPTQIEIQVEGACVDYRDTLVGAEYPKYVPWGKKWEGTPELAKIHEENWRQYRDWLDAE